MSRRIENEPPHDLLSSDSSSLSFEKLKSVFGTHYRLSNEAFQSSHLDAPISQGGRLCDSDGNLGPEAFEEAFRDLLRHFAQRRLADSACGTATAHEAEAAQLGALKMLMLNLERAELSSVQPNRWVGGQGSVRQGGSDNFKSSSESSGHRMLPSCINHGDSVCHDRDDSTAAGGSRTGSTRNPQKSHKDGAVGAVGGQGTNTDIAAIERAVNEVLWEQRRVSAAQETTAAVVEEILLLLREQACLDNSRVIAGNGNIDSMQKKCILGPGSAANKPMQVRLDAEHNRESKLFGTAVDGDQGGILQASESTVMCVVDHSAYMGSHYLSHNPAGQRLCTVDSSDISKEVSSQYCTEFCCQGTG